MAHNRAGVIALVVAVCLGFSLGRCGSDDPEVKVVEKTRFVKVPVVKTHVEYRDKFVPLPSACTDAVAALSKVESSTGALTKNAGIIADALNELGLGYATNDVHTVNKALDVIGPAKSALENAANTKSETIDDISTLISRCQKEVADGP